MGIRVYPNWKMNFNSKDGTNRCFSYETKSSIHLSEWAEWICGAQSLKEWILLCESMFILIEGQTLILRKVERKAVHVKLKHQYL